MIAIYWIWCVMQTGSPWFAPQVHAHEKVELLHFPLQWFILPSWGHHGSVKNVNRDINIFSKEGVVKKEKSAFFSYKGITSSSVVTYSFFCLMKNWVWRKFEDNFCTKIRNCFHRKHFVASGGRNWFQFQILQ